MLSAIYFNLEQSKMSSGNWLTLFQATEFLIIDFLKQKLSFIEIVVRKCYKKVKS